MQRVLAGAVLVLALTAAPSAAHVRSTTGYSQIREQDGEVQYRLSLESDLLAAAAGHGAPGDYVLPLVEVSIDGVGCEGSLQHTDRARRDGRHYTAISGNAVLAGAWDGNLYAFAGR
jgi:hypothetical protein